MEIKSIILSRTDSLGDVILSLPLAGAIKKHNPEIKIYFIGRTYSKSIIEISNFIDEFINYDEIINKNLAEQIKKFRNINADAIIHVFPNKNIAKLAKKAHIPIRIGTSHRFFHFFTCNKRPNFTRKNSNLHEVELNFKLLEPLNINTNYSLNDIPDLYGYSSYKPLSEKLANLLSNKRFNLILHPKSKGSAREWGLDNFSELVQLLPENKYKIFVTGTHEEAKLMTDFLLKYKGRVVDLTGRLSLDELVSFTNKSNGLVAASTGPLHIAAATGIKAIGIFAPMRPIHPGRWKPIGKKADYLVIKNENCTDCRNGSICHCIMEISAKKVYEKLIKN